MFWEIGSSDYEKMAKTKYLIKLDNLEYEKLNAIVGSGDESDRTILRAKILLASDLSRHPVISVTKLAEELGTTRTTIQTVRTEYATGGLEATVFRKKRTPGFINKRINDDVIRQIQQIYAEDPPEGKKKWSIRMLCKEVVDRRIVDHIAPSTMAAILNQAKTE